MDELISRQAAIEAFYKHPNIDWTTIDVLAEIKALPSAQPEIIRCKDCKAYDSHDKRCKVWNHGVAEYEYCYRGWKE